MYVIHIAYIIICNIHIHKYIYKSIYNDLLLDEGVLELELLLEDGEVAGGRTQVTGDTAQRVLQHIIMMLVSQYNVDNK